jgi:hypothetical protein
MFVWGKIYIEVRKIQYIFNKTIYMDTVYVTAYKATVFLPTILIFW